MCFVLILPRRAATCYAHSMSSIFLYLVSSIFWRKLIWSCLLLMQTTNRTHLTLLQLGMASAMETLCGQAFGAKRYHMLGIYLQRSWIVLFLCAILLLPVYLFATPILLLIGQAPDIAKLSGQLSIWFIPLHFSFVLLLPQQRFLQCQQRNLVNAVFSAAALVLHIFISWLFMQKLRLGLVAAALTLNFSWWIVVLGQFGYIVFGGCPITWKGFSMEAFSDTWVFVKLSVASGIMLRYLSFSHAHKKTYRDISMKYELILWLQSINASKWSD